MDTFTNFLEPVYTAEEVANIRSALSSFLSTRKGKTHPERQTYWYKFIEIYCIYPNAIVYDAALSPLQNLKRHLSRIKSLGCNAVHILPFLESPMVDRGFDISDYYTIRRDLGTLNDLRSLINEAQRLELRLFMDFVLNHVSDRHEWFQKAVQGNEKYRNYFIHTDRKPDFIRKYCKDSAVWAEYNVAGESRHVTIAFPEYTGPIPHWREESDGYWYYHTYYPQQPDLNWLNPDVFVEVAKILIYWGELGFNFRLDAIPFVGKGAYKSVDIINKKVHAIIKALKYLSEQVNPESCFLVESYEQLDAVIKYFGSNSTVQSNLSYNFHLCTSIWTSLVKQDAHYIWDKLEEKLSKVPEHGEWLNFLRNHDELSLAYLPDDLLNEIQAALLQYGADFREGFGISGRTYSLLACNKKRFLMAYFLLASMPGGIVIPYGDEIAAQNIPPRKLPPAERGDTRNINRGVLFSKQYYSHFSRTVFNELATIIGFRKYLRCHLNTWPTRLPYPPEIFAASYQKENSNGNQAESEESEDDATLKIFINLSGTEQAIGTFLSSVNLVAHVNAIKIENDKITLGPYAGIWIKS